MPTTEYYDCRMSKGGKLLLPTGRCKKKSTDSLSLPSLFSGPRGTDGEAESRLFISLLE
jgi:hypothetical protein